MKITNTTLALLVSVCSASTQAQTNSFSNNVSGRPSNINEVNSNNSAPTQPKTIINNGNTAELPYGNVIIPDPDPTPLIPPPGTVDTPKPTPTPKPAKTPQAAPAAPTKDTLSSPPKSVDPSVPPPTEVPTPAPAAQSLP